MDLAKKYEIKILSIDLDKNPLIKGQFLVFLAPTVLLLNEKREILRESRFIDIKNINKHIESLLRKY